MLKTPNYSHFSTKDYETIYEPSEDTFLLLDALENDINHLNNLKPLFVFEIGSGSGLVINFLAEHLANSKHILFYSTDVNKNACLATKKTAHVNNNDINIVNCDLVLPMLDKLNGKIDILIFNPPYVVTEPDELGSMSIEAAWAGGKDGREVMDRLFPHVNTLLSQNGVFYLVCIKQNKIEEIEAIFKMSNFEMNIVLNRKAGIENLFILRFTRLLNNY
jgi:release factor glutamine methyltransferase